MIPLFKWHSNHRKDDEQKYVDLFKKINLSDGFYFSYTYDLTHTLQYNMLQTVKKEQNKKMLKSQDEFRETLKNKNMDYNDAKIAYLDQV